MTITRLLVPNRGEIAVRIARACRDLRIESVLAFSEDDDSRYVKRFFDRTISLGAGDARSTYLDVAKVVEAARASGSQAIHPGYGFLSERAELAKACEDAGIIFVGPKSHSIAAMGSKAESRHLMQRLGVPVVPGYDGDEQADAHLLAEARRIGFPLLVKASAGGGGKGMKIVRSDAEIQPSIESARREASKAFGNDRLLLERYIEQPRHVEFQIFGDSHGNVVHLFERDCSIQRRHQKVVEESPAPRYSEELRQRMAQAAVAAARGVQYENAGTVEFIVTPENDFYFLEMNTRLQVEHPVTELVTGVDLVRAQIAVANGEALPWTQEQLTQRGHAMEVRIYAEDPDDRFLPQSGTIATLLEPSGPGVRVDSGVMQGTEIGVKFDPMLAKLICYGATRDECIDRLLRALSDYVILGTKTNVSYLKRIVGHAAFRAGDVSTAFVVEHEAALVRDTNADALAVAAVLASLPHKVQTEAGSGAPRTTSVWDAIGPWGR
jgi:3-methylcrotonyl-CoA carboxylase alpha subunit